MLFIIWIVVGGILGWLASITGIISARIGNPVSRPGSINPARSTLAASIARQRPSRLDSALLSSSDPPFDALPSVTT